QRVATSSLPMELSRAIPHHPRTSMAAAATAGGTQAAAVAAHPVVRARAAPAAGGGADPAAGSGGGGVLSRCGVGAGLTAHQEARQRTPRRSPAISRAR